MLHTMDFWHLDNRGINWRLRRPQKSTTPNSPWHGVDSSAEDWAEQRVD